MEKQFTVQIGQQTNFRTYLNSYKDAFDLIYNSIEDGKVSAFEIVFPLLFLARHTMEIGFKYNIKYFQKYSESSEATNSDSHSLKMLFHAFKNHIRKSIENIEAKTGGKFPDTTLNIINFL